MKKILFLMLAAMMVLPAMATKKSKAEKDTKQYRYEIECAGSAVSGTYLVRVYSYSKKASVAEDQCRKNAVHGVIFKGVAAGENCAYKAPLVKTPGAEEQYKDFFASFFKDGGEFQRYASIIAGTQTSDKVGKEYKVGVTVSIQIDQLRKALESAGVIRGLSSGF